jgi:hypothetical protein
VGASQPVGHQGSPGASSEHDDALDHRSRVSVVVLAR